jgi:hypothetical protein
MYDYETHLFEYAIHSSFVGKSKQQAIASFAMATLLGALLLRATAPLPRGKSSRMFAEYISQASHR